MKSFMCLFRLTLVQSVFFSHRLTEHESFHMVRKPLSGIRINYYSLNDLESVEVGLPRCGGPARVPAGGIVRAAIAFSTPHVAPLVRGAVGAARRPYLAHALIHPALLF